MQNPETCGTDDDYWSYEGVFRGVVEGACQVPPAYYSTDCES